jgi:predicted DNA-binding transcriptional regulator AlpA
MPRNKPMPAPAAKPLCVSVPEFAGLMSIHKATAYRLVRDGHVPCLQLGDRKVIPVAWIEATVAKAAAAE